MSAFDDAFDTLMGNEGGYVDDPRDPGGATCWGVTERVARLHGYTGAMRDLPRDTAKQIAKLQYWDVVRGDALDPRLAFQVFDAEYNGGHPIEWLQQAAGTKVDGLFGPNTLAAVNACDPEKLMMRFDAYRLQYLSHLQIWPSFGRGWVNRIANNLLKGAA